MGVGELASSKRPSIKRRWRYTPLMSAPGSGEAPASARYFVGHFGTPLLWFFITIDSTTDALRSSG